MLWVLSAHRSAIAEGPVIASASGGRAPELNSGAVYLVREGRINAWAIHRYGLAVGGEATGVEHGEAGIVGASSGIRVAGRLCSRGDVVAKIPLVREASLAAANAVESGRKVVGAHRVAGSWQRRRKL